mgnify:CR=1 FL=1
MDEILYELREHSAGLNAGRWDYIFSVIKKFRDRPEFVLPDRTAVTMTVPFMRAYAELLVKTCHRRGAFAMGGMAAFIPSRRDAEVNERALAKVREDKQREAGDGFDGTWVAHPDLVPIGAGGVRPRPRRAARTSSTGSATDVVGHRGRLLDVAATPGEVTEDGLRQQRLASGSSTSSAWLARHRRGGDRQPDGGRGDGGDRALAGLAVDSPRPLLSASACASVIDEELQSLLRTNSATRSTTTSRADEARDDLRGRSRSATSSRRVPDHPAYEHLRPDQEKPRPGSGFSRISLEAGRLSFLRRDETESLGIVITAASPF